MKKLFYFIITLVGLSSSAQVGIGLPTENIAASAQFEVASTTKGFLTPRMTEAQKNAIASPAAGLLVYQTDGTNGFYYYNGSSWNSVGANLTGYATTSALSSEVTRAQNAETMLNTTVNTNAVQSNLAIQNVTSIVNQEVSRAQSAEATLTTSLNNKAPKASPSLTGAVTVGGASSTTSAVVEVTSTSQGFLPPRMTATQRNAISSPAAGLVLWCSNCGTNGELQVYNGTAWTNFVGGTALSVIVSVGQSFLGGLVAYILQPGDVGYDANTQHGIIAQSQDAFCNATWYSAITVNTSTVGGYNDWFLPNKDQLNKLWFNRAIIGGFNGNYYWSSTEGSNTNDAFLQNFQHGNGNDGFAYGKSATMCARAIRIF